MREPGRPPLPIRLAEHGLSPASMAYDLIKAFATEAGLSARERSGALLRFT